MKKYVLVVLVIVFTVVVLVLNRPHNRAVVLDDHTVAPTPPVHSSRIFDPDFLTQAYDKGQQYTKISNDTVVGGIIPHHLLAAPLIAGFFQGISHQHVRTVVLISPNHRGTGKYNISTSKGVWSTLYGNLEVDRSKVDTVISNTLVGIDEDLFDIEHGIYGLTPFIKKTFPDSKIIPIAIKHGTPKNELDTLVKSLNAVMDTQTLVLVSSDFSHYLPSDQADTYDKQSIETLQALDTEGVLRLDPQKNTDSPDSLYTLLTLMKLQKAEHETLLQNTNSAKLTKQPDLSSTTSYVTMYFSKQLEPTFSMNDVFKYVDPTTIKKTDNPDEFTLLATGDVMTARSVNTKVVSMNDFTYPFKNIADFLKRGDAALINLETPLTPDCKLTQEGMTFCGDLKNVQGLVYAGVNVASIANNHMGNQGLEGIQSTVNVLKQHNINVTGNGEPAIVSVHGMTIGFLGYNGVGNKQKGIAYADIDQIRQDIQTLKQRANIIVVAMHWGTEYTSTPNTFQVELAHKIIDAGADLIIGNHPHWVQGVEEYNGKFIAYSHGNLVFDQMWSQETREGVVGRYTFTNNKLTNVQFIPVIIENYSQPRFAAQQEATKILERMKNGSK